MLTPKQISDKTIDYKNSLPDEDVLGDYNESFKLAEGVGYHAGVTWANTENKKEVQAIIEAYEEYVFLLKEHPPRINLPEDRLKAREKIKLLIDKL